MSSRKPKGRTGKAARPQSPPPAPAESPERDWLDEQLDEAAQVEVRGKTIQLRVPELPQLRAVQDHMNMDDEAQTAHEGGQLGWATRFFALAIAATWPSERLRTIDEWERVVLWLTDDDNPLGQHEGIQTALDLCGCKAPSADGPLAKVEEATGETPS